MSNSKETNNNINVKLNCIRDSKITIAGGNVTSGTTNKANEPYSKGEQQQPGLQPAKVQSQDEFKYDVFVSYSHKNKKWVWEWLLPRLQKAGIKVCIDLDCFEPGAPVITEIERATIVSRKTLLVLTPGYLQSEWAELENLLTASQDPAARKRRLIPVLLERCELPLRLKSLIYLDFTNQQATQDKMNRLIASLLPTESVINSTPQDDFSLTRRFRPLDEDDLGEVNDFSAGGLQPVLIYSGNQLDRQCTSWQHQLSESEHNLHLIEERLSEYVESINSPLELVKRKRQLEQHIKELTAMIAENCPADAEVPPDKKDLNPNRNDQLATLKAKLLIHQKNLAQLEIQSVKYGSLDVPLRLLNQIDDEKQEIKRLEDLLK